MVLRSWLRLALLNNGPDSIGNGVRERTARRNCDVGPCIRRSDRPSLSGVKHIDVKKRSMACVALLTVVVLASGCGSDRGSANPTETSRDTIATTLDTSVADTAADTSVPQTSIPDTSVATTDAATSLPASTVPVSTDPASTDPASTGKTAACDFVGAQIEQRFEFPNLMTSEIGADIRTGANECYERVVIELQEGFAPTDAGMPGWLVRYADGPVTLGQTDDQFAELDGDADLLITMNAWMSTFDGSSNRVGYDGPHDIRPTNTRAIRELLLVDDFEGQHTWAVGLDQRRDFRVFTLTGPDRLVVDIAI